MEVPGRRAHSLHCLQRVACALHDKTAFRLYYLWRRAAVDVDVVSDIAAAVYDTAVLLCHCFFYFSFFLLYFILFLFHFYFLPQVNLGSTRKRFYPQRVFSGPASSLLPPVRSFLSRLDRVLQRPFQLFCFFHARRLASIFLSPTRVLLAFRPAML